ncbi:phosphoglycerate dehydrogenase [Streptomyces sp. NPDC006422]|uniref:phosphoglycerate dehydrogenase n=1 Tax=unclassified Streptomyces TaxID=2593676 RepID=UPI0033B1610F
MSAATTLITTPTFARHAAEPWQLLADGGAGPVRPGEDTALPPDELLRHLADADALIVGMDTITAEVLDAASKLKVVAKHGVGTDTIDLDAARERGIPVVCAPGTNSRAVAEYTFGLILDATRGITASHTAVAAGGWPKHFGCELHGQNLGIVGFGRIGRLVAGYAHAFGLRVLAHDPHIPDDALRTAGAEPATLDALLAAADLVTLHLPPAAAPLLTARRLAVMKPGAALVNAARGGLVDESALADALHSGHLSAAALDAFTTEPLPADHPLRTAPRTVLTSHMAACTPQANRAMGVTVAEDILRVLSGREPLHPAS